MLEETSLCFSEDNCPLIWRQFGSALFSVKTSSSAPFLSVSGEEICQCSIYGEDNCTTATYFVKTIMYTIPSTWVQVFIQDFKIYTYLSEHMYRNLFEEIPWREGARLGRLCDGWRYSRQLSSNKTKIQSVKLTHFFQNSSRNSNNSAAICSCH